MATKYDASSIKVIKNDRERIQQSPNMYIPNRSKLGQLHCYTELWNNSCDEITIPNSVGHVMKISFNEVTKEFIVEDDGRGIPHEKLYDVVTVLAASGKFNNGENSAYLASGGAFGHGMTVVWALSSEFDIFSTREGKRLGWKFSESKSGLKEEKIEEKADSKKHGTWIRCIINPKYIDTSELTGKDILASLEEESYIFPQITTEVTIINKKGEKKYKFGGKSIIDRVNKWNLTTTMVEVHDTRKQTFLKSIADAELTTEKIKIDCAFAYSEDVLDNNPEDYLISYVNTIKTYAGGAHVDGVKLGIQKWFKEVVIPKFKGKDKDLPIMPSDMVNGLCLFITVSLSAPEFRGQEKNQLSNNEVKLAVRDAVYEMLCSEKSSVTNPMIDFVKRITRGRMASKKSRKKDVDNAFSKDKPEKYKPIINNINTESPELLLVEGDSAAGNAASARDPYNQGIYGIRRPKNIFDMDSEHVNRILGTFNDVLDICGVEAGKKCDPEKSAMQRILMLTDGDVDGDDIAISTVCLLAKHCRPLIDAGMVGRILPPAYSIPTGKGKYIYVRSQREFFDKITKSFIKNESVAIDKKELDKKALREFIERNFEYDLRLEKLANRYCMDPKVMEYIAWSYHGSVDDQKQSYWMNKMKKYPGIRILKENGTLIMDGDIPGADYMSLPLDSHFDKHVKRFKEFQAKNSTIYGYSISGSDDKSLYDVMHMIRKYIPKGVKRFKGLGELDPDEMRELCMDPKSRTVVIFKFKDFEKDMDKISIIMSTKKEYAEARKNILMSATASDLDIDT